MLMLLADLPMLMRCLNLIDNAALDYTYAGAGCFAAGIAYIFSMVTAIAGLVFAERLHRHRWCRTLGYIQPAAGVLLILLLRAYAVLMSLLLFLLTVLYLFGVAGAKSGITSNYERSVEMAKKKTGNNIPLPIFILVYAVLLFAIYTSISTLALAI